MNVPVFLRKPLVAAVLGAATIAAPVSALYLAGANRASASPAAPTAPATVSPLAVPAAALPDFSAMVQHYGPAVVNIAVVTKATPAFNSGDDEDDDSDGNGNGNSQGNPFGPNSPFGPFFRGQPFQGRPAPVRGEGSGFIISATGSS